MPTETKQDICETPRNIARLRPPSPPLFGVLGYKLGRRPCPPMFPPGTVITIPAARMNGARLLPVPEGCQVTLDDLLSDEP